MALALPPPFDDPLVVLALLAFGPPLLYLAGLALRHPGRSAGPALAGFLYGATLCLVVLAALYFLLALALGNPVGAFQTFFADQLGRKEGRDFVLVVVIGPLMEEAAKGLGVWLLGGRFATRRDGTFLGASVGLGFAAVETLTYLLAALGPSATLAGDALLSVLGVAAVRSVSSALLHPAATGITGYGIARSKLKGTPVPLGALPFYLGAVALHATYNELAGFLPPQDLGGLTVSVNLLAALVLASLAWGGLKRAVAAPH